MKTKNVRYIVIGIVAVLLLVVGIYMLKNVFPTVNATIEIANALKPFIDAENKSMQLVIDAEMEEKEFQLKTEVYSVKEDATDYLVLKLDNFSFYVLDNLFILENGKAFLLTEEKQDMQVQNVSYTDMLLLLAAAFEEFEINRTEENTKVYYQIEVTGEQVKHILETTMPSQVGIGDVVECLQIQLTTEDGRLDNIQMSGTGLSVTISNFAMLEDGDCNIPQLIKDSAESVEKDKLFCLTEDLYRLIKAVQPLSDMSKLQGKMNWKVSCGLIQINTSIDMKKLNALNKDDSSSAGSETETAARLIGVVGAMVMEGEIGCHEQNELYVYELVLEEAAMKKIVELMAPEIISYAVDFEKGSMEIEIKDEKLSEITIGIEGSFKALITRVPVSVSVTIYFE